MITGQNLHPAILRERKRVGERIRERRRELHYSLREVSTKIDCTNTYLRDVELGLIPISLAKAKMLAETLRMPLETIKWGDDKRNKLCREAVGRMVKTRRKILGLTQTQLSFKVETRLILIGDIERGKGLIPLNKLDLWFEVLGIDHHLLRGDYFKEGMIDE